SVYDAAGRVASTREYANAATLAALPLAPSAADVAANLVADAARDRVTQYFYDGDGRLTRTIDALGGVVDKFYDANGNVIRTVAYASGSTPGAYDEIDRTVYDAANRPIWTIDASGAVTRTRYDANGNVLRVRQYASTVTVSGDPTDAQMRTLMVSNN